MQAYCVKCREKQEIASPKAVFLGEQARPATQGICPECGTKITRFGRTPAHDGLDPAAHTIASKASEQRQTSGPKMVIVESPAKARTVGRFLGRGYCREASVGHIRDLPANRMGVDIEHDFEPRYVIPAKKKDVVKELQAKAKQASEVYLATDPDREGEAIAWHLRAALERQLRGIPVHRVEFHEITQEAIDHAFAHPRRDRPAAGRCPAGTAHPRPCGGLHPQPAAAGQDGPQGSVGRPGAVGRPAPDLRARARDPGLCAGGVLDH